MQMCQSHWDILREEVEEQGLNGMVSANGEIMAMKMQAEISSMGTDEEERIEDFDPLMRAWFMIMSRTLDMVGLYAFTADFGCPICALNSKRTEDGACSCGSEECGAKEPGSIPDFVNWIKGPDSCVASIREMCVERGWIK